MCMLFFPVVMKWVIHVNDGTKTCKQLHTYTNPVFAFFCTSFVTSINIYPRFTKLTRSSRMKSFEKGDLLFQIILFAIKSTIILFILCNFCAWISFSLNIPQDMLRLHRAASDLTVQHIGEGLNTVELPQTYETQKSALEGVLRPYILFIVWIPKLG